MAEDELKKENTGDLSDKILDYGMDAAAIGVAAVSFYRAGGRNLLSRGLNNFSRHASRYKRIIDEYDYDHIDSDSLKDIYKRLKNVRSEIKEDIRNNHGGEDPVKISLRSGTTNETLANAFALRESEHNDIYQMAYHQHVTEAVQQRALDYMTKFYGQRASKFDKEKITSFFENVVKNAREESDWDSTYMKMQRASQKGSSKFEKAYQAAFNDAVALNKHYDEVIKPKLKNVKNPNDEIFDLLIKRLNKVVGSYGKPRLKDTVLGDRPMTYREIIDAYKKGKIEDTTVPYADQDGNRQAFSFLKKLDEYLGNLKKEDKKKYEAIANTYADELLRISPDGVIHSFSAMSGAKQKIISAAARTLPGKIFRIGDIEASETTPTFFKTMRGAWDPVLSALEGKDKYGGHRRSDNKVLHTYYRIVDQTYMYDEATGKLKLIDELNGATPVSTRIGGMGNLVKDMGGLNQERYRDEDSLLRIFDFNGGVSQNPWEYLSGLTKRDSSYLPNIIEDIERGNVEISYDQIRTFTKVNEFLLRSVSSLDAVQLKALSESKIFNQSSKHGAEDNKSASFILNKLLSDSDEDLLEGLVGHVEANGDRGYQFYNNRLNKLISEYHKNPWEAMNSIALDMDTTGSYALFGEDFTNVGHKFYDQLRKELSKEFFLRVANSEEIAGDTGFEKIKNLIESLPLNPQEETAAKRLGYVAQLNLETGEHFTGYGKRRIGDNVSEKSLSEDIRIFAGAIDGTLDNSETAADVSENLKNIVKENKLNHYLHSTGRDTSNDKELQFVPNNYVYLRNSAGPLDLIKSINESIKNDSLGYSEDEEFSGVIGWANRFLSQFTAGRSNMMYASRATFFPYFFLRRLGADDVPAFMQFSNDSLKSTGALAKTLAKRIALVGTIATQLEWLDDTVGALTGTRASAGFVNGLDYLDIGGRQLLDATGIGSLLNDQMNTNPILQYWFGRDGYYNADQERDYYVNGYEPVRRGRYWSFGSVNEFRGGSIEYFRPNLTRRLNSDYYNKSLYSSYWDKWNHSLMPTLSNPLSPLFYIADPYYLEEEHYNDRPYPVTGPMFSRDTPWGAILNPTIGELIKPEKKMHQDRLEDGKDAQAIIYQINKRIRDVADGNHAYTLTFNRDQLDAGEYTSYASPAMGEYNVEIGRDKTEQDKDKQAAVLGNDSELQKRDILYSYGSGSSTSDGSFSIGVDGEGGAGGSGSPLDMLGQTNRNIKAIAAQNTRGGVLTTTRIIHSRMDDILSNGDNVQDLINASTGMDLVREGSETLRLLSGIYGYGASRFGFGERNKNIADSGDIDSFSRAFWDESIGGIGGGAAEIIRRFIPEFRRSQRVNPLLNNLPDWLPENLRMGDAYASIPDGEARLPGKGYEALNNLHPDSFGVYGAYDRYKILADVAPASSEFKIWKSIAQKTIKDPDLVSDMAKIQDRVNQQNKAHDFYPYKFIGEDVEYQTVTLSKVNKDGTFMIRGSNELYKMAGIDTKANIERRTTDRFQTSDEQIGALSAIREYMNPGQEITIAVDNNEYHRHNSDAFNTVNAAVFVDGESVAQRLLEDHGDIFARKTDGTNAADTWAMTSSFGRFTGSVAEFVAHLDLPMIHDRWLRVRDPLESYQAEQVYGTPYQTWSDLLGTFLFPAMERSVSNHFDVIKSTAEYFLLQSMRDKQGLSFLKRTMLSGASALMDRGAFIGAALATIVNPGSGKLFERATKIGAIATVLGNMYTSSQSSTVDSAASWAQAGWMVGDVLDTRKKELENLKATSLIKRFFRSTESFDHRAKFALAGAAVGIMARGMFGPGALSDERDNWTPERVQKKWELEDYFDRISYIKYMGLYHKAAREALDKEGIDIERIFDEHDAWQKRRQEIIEDSSVYYSGPWQAFRRSVNRAVGTVEKYLNQEAGSSDNQNHRFEYNNGFSINDLPGVRNGVFHSEEISEEERLYTLNALVSMGIQYGEPGSARTNEDRDMTQLTQFEKVYGVKIPTYYQVHHIVQFSKEGADNPSNMIALNPDDHLYITEAHERYWSGAWTAGKEGARTAVRLGEYGRAALLYKKAAESTMYGLRADARWTDIVKALPRYERDYFTEFMKEKDPEKQQEILRTVSPFLRRALKQVWGMDYEEDKGPSNEEYFENHNLPNFNWEGWDPDSDLNKIKAKTIKNEGLLFSDFGIYESTYRDQAVINAPNLSTKGSGNPITVGANLAAELNGLGLTGVDVSVEPRSTGGIQSVINLTNVVKYKVNETVNDIFA